MSRRVATVLTAATLVAAVGTALAPAPGWAAGCGGEEGVSVVVDFHQLGGGVKQACDPAGAGKTAGSLFADNGFALTYVQRQPGFVCRVSGAPADDPCVNTPPADAYWAVFWSDGTSGTWSYATQGVGSLTVPDGGSVALSWQGSETKSPPGVAPRTDPQPSPTPTPSPSRTPTRSPSDTSQEPSASTAPSPTQASSDATASGSPSGRSSRRPRPSKTSSASDSASPTPAPVGAAAAGPGDGGGATVTDPGGGVPGWVVPAVLVGLLGAGAATAYTRGRRRDDS